MIFLALCTYSRSKRLLTTSCKKRVKGALGSTGDLQAKLDLRKTRGTAGWYSGLKTILNEQVFCFLLSSYSFLSQENFVMLIKRKKKISIGAVLTSTKGCKPKCIDLNVDTVAIWTFTFHNYWKSSNWCEIGATVCKMLLQMYIVRGMTLELRVRMEEQRVDL